MDENLVLVNSLCNNVDISDSNQLSSTLVNVYEYNGKINPLIHKLIRSEVQATSNINLT